MRYSQRKSFTSIDFVVHASNNEDSNKIKKINEENKTPVDTEGVYKIIDTLKLLKPHLKNINNTKA